MGRQEVTLESRIYIRRGELFRDVRWDFRPVCFRLVCLRECGRDLWVETLCPVFFLDLT